MKMISGIALWEDAHSFFSGKCKTLAVLKSNRIVAPGYVRVSLSSKKYTVYDRTSFFIISK